MKTIIITLALIFTSAAYSQSDSTIRAQKKEAHHLAWKSTVASTVLIIITKPKTLLRRFAVGLFFVSLTGVIVTSGE